MADDTFKRWSVSYGFDGAQWVMYVMARDADEAKRRIDAASAFGVVDGEIIMEVPAVVGWWVPFAVWLRNRFRI